MFLAVFIYVHYVLQENNNSNKITVCYINLFMHLFISIYFILTYT